MAPKPPALINSDELRETVDLLAQVMASMSDRLDSQGNRFDELMQLSKAIRKDGTGLSLAAISNLMGNSIDHTLIPAIARLEKIEAAFREHRSATDQRMKELASHEEQALERLRREIDDAQWAKFRSRGFAAAVAVLSLLLGAMIGLMF